MLAELDALLDRARAGAPVVALLSLQAIVSAVARLRAARLLLIAARATAPDAAGATEVGDILDRLPAVPVRVPPLTPEQIRLLAARAVGVNLPLPVARRLGEHTAGIPRYLLEILRDTPADRWSDWQAPLPVPTGLQSRVRTALAGCSPATRALVEAAAVLGASPVLADAAVLGEVPDPIAGLLGPATARTKRPGRGHPAARGRGRARRCGPARASGRRPAGRRGPAARAAPP